ncbi:MAG: hypothetical protein WC867_05405 [Candidatus Pacearchaeota archaeon]|jgi:hypothetical protein
MIALGNGLRIEIPKKEKSVYFDIKKEIEMQLMQWGDQFGYVNNPEYNDFIRQSSFLSERYTYMRFPLEMMVKEYSDATPDIEVGIEFPSNELYPVIQYDSEKNKYFFPHEDNNPYFFIVNKIRSGKLECDCDFKMAEILAFGVDKKGLYNGEPIIYPHDVDMISDIAKKLYETSF